MHNVPICGTVKLIVPMHNRVIKSLVKNSGEKCACLPIRADTNPYGKMQCSHAVTILTAHGLCV